MGSTQCDVDSECSNYVANSYCDQTSKTCDCRLGFHRSNDLHSCPATYIGDPCPSHEGCKVHVSGSFCSSGICFCKLGYSASNGVCTTLKIGEACTLAQQCPAVIDSSSCDGTTQTCQCIAGYMSNSLKDTCTKRKLGDPCSTNGDCAAAIAGTICKSGSCSCESGWYPDQNNTFCIERVIGDTCLTHPDCEDAVANSYCNMRKCTCLKGYGPINGNRTCARVPLFQIECSKDEDCLVITPLTQCNEKKVCECQTGFVTNLKGTICGTFQLGLTECYTSVTCQKFEPNAICIKNRCVCSARYHENHNNTVCLVNYIGQLQCTTDAYCEGKIPGSECDNITNVCECKRGYYTNPTSTECSARILDIDACVQELDCPEGADCINNVCKCMSNMNYIKATNYTCQGW